MMRALCYGLFLLALGCGAKPKEPTTPPGPFLVVFRPWPVSQEDKAPPSGIPDQLLGVEKEIFQARGALFEDEALRQAKREVPCKDIPCAAEVARQLNATWFVVGQVRAFPPDR